MQLTIKPFAEYNGFDLQSPVILNGNISVLTGKNGSGKTRFLECISNSCCTAFINEKQIMGNEISYIRQSDLNPNLGYGYNHQSYQEGMLKVLTAYDSIKNEIDDPSFLERARFISDSNIDYVALISLCHEAATSTNKAMSELTHDDISFYYRAPSKSILGIQNISEISNQYIKRINANEYNAWRNERGGCGLINFTKDKYNEIFGGKPWEIINDILNDTFDGKFYFNSPDETSLNYNYEAELFQKNGSRLSVGDLSSGEKTLLWLALTIFNSQYVNNQNTQAPTILLLDEPDAFLHPKMVVKMYDTLESFSKKFNTAVILTTHSPTSVALASENSIYLVEDNYVHEIEKDSAIADLLDGVSQISLNPHNRRQVFVESIYDVNAYQLIYTKLVTRSSLINPKITLNFISSGPKMPRKHLIDLARSKLKVSDETMLNNFCDAVNGSGNCVQVIAQVEALIDNHSDTVRGIVDWDLKGRSTSHIKVFASNYAYSIENVTLDPVCILLLLHIDNNMPMLDICGSNITWQNWLKDNVLLQESIDRFILRVLEKQNNKLSDLNYFSGVSLKTDSDCLEMNGHKLEKLLKEKYEGLKSFCRKGGDGELKCAIVSKSMIKLTDCDFIPKAFDEILSEVQK